MKISYNWLKEYVDVKISPEKLAETLTMAGLSVESVSKLGGDSVLEIEITANRPDWLSVTGVAREVAALTGGRLKVHAPSKAGSQKKSAGAPFKVKVEDRKLCPRYTARAVYGVKVGPSPDWLKARIEAMGLRSVNNVVDITNFCLFETGEPMHAFDLDRISGSAVIVRRAQKSEKILLIDGSEKTLDDAMLVIADEKKPVAVAGVMGGISTEVNFSTANILLEAAYFDPISVRRTARKLGISTDSSYRFERRVDISNVVSASERALGLILDICGGTAGRFIDLKSPAKKAGTVELNFNRLNDLLGVEIPPAKVRKIVTSIGMKIKSASAKSLKLGAPGFRHDIKAEVDVIEEVARVYGYNNIPATLPDIVEQPVRTEPEMVFSQKTRDCLAAMGAYEIMTYSLLSRKSVAAAGFNAAGTIDIKNPLTSEQESMRPSLVPGMLGAILWNINRKSKDLKLFELGNVYMKGPDGGFSERKHLCIGFTGQAFESWTGASRPADFFELKGAAEALFAELGVKDVSFRRANRDGFCAGACAEISVAGNVVGIMGEVSVAVLKNFDIKEKVCLLEADAEAIFAGASLGGRFADLPKYPSVFRDISIVAGKDISNSEVVSVIRAAGGDALKEARLVDRYKGKQIPEDKVSLTYRLEYRDPARTLEEKHVAEVHAKVLRDLDEKLGARLR
jgi:phenylalanyl-tRNA synthetase beta chain